MPQGLQIFNAGGDLILDVTDRLTRVLGEFETGTKDGRIIDNALTTGEPWFIAIGIDAYFTYGEMGCAITINENILSWTFSPGSRGNKKIIYGVY